MARQLLQTRETAERDMLMQRPLIKNYIPARSRQPQLYYNTRVQIASLSSYSHTRLERSVRIFGRCTILDAARRASVLFFSSNNTLVSKSRGLRDSSTYCYLHVFDRTFGLERSFCNPYFGFRNSCKVRFFLV